MNDYRNFPFKDFTTDEIAKMAIDSERLHDDEFVKACVEEIKKRKPHEQLVIHSDPPNGLDG